MTIRFCWKKNSIHEVLADVLDMQIKLHASQNHCMKRQIKVTRGSRTVWTIKQRTLVCIIIFNPD